MQADDNYCEEYFKTFVVQLGILAECLNEKERQHIFNTDEWWCQAMKDFLGSEFNDTTKNFVEALHQRVFEMTTEYTATFSFIPKEPDSVKIIYWLVYVLYKKNILKDMELIRRMLEENISVRDKIKIQKIITDTQILPKFVLFSKNGYEKFALIYGDSSISGYQIYKLIHEIIYLEVPELNNKTNLKF